MTKATEDLLGTLHGKVAQSMIDSIEQADYAGRILSKKRDEPLPDDVLDFLSTLTEVSPSLLTAAAKFLKDNHISCDSEDSDEMEALQETLKKKRIKDNITAIKFEG